jgi:transcriptional accessory protein Tex/SPT6
MNLLKRKKLKKGKMLHGKRMHDGTRYRQGSSFESCKKHNRKPLRIKKSENHLKTKKNVRFRGVCGEQGVRVLFVIPSSSSRPHVSSFSPLFLTGMLLFFQKSQKRKERASRVKRDTRFSERTPLSELQPGMQVSGKVISNTNFGSYVDVGTECDGLLHVSQMTRDFFVEHPRQVVQPGDVVTVIIASTNPELKKLHLTMLLPSTVMGDEDDDDEERIPLQDTSVDDELWGEIKRVTAFGAYVELGAVVDGFLHFMDHPQFGVNPGAPPSDFMRVGDRIRVWVSDVDTAKSRIKLTANRPAHLPGPRRDIY